MLPLIGLALEAAPYIARWVSGSKAEEATTTVTDIVKSVVGENPVTADQLKSKSPELWTQLQIKLGEFHDAQETRLHTERLKEFEDRVDARKNYVNSKAITDHIAKTTLRAFFLLNSAVVIALIAMLYYGAPGFVKSNVELSLAAWGVINAVLGWINSKADVTYNFYMGSSHGSSEGREAMANVLNKLLKR